MFKAFWPRRKQHVRVQRLERVRTWRAWGRGIQGGFSEGDGVYRCLALRYGKLGKEQTQSRDTFKGYYIQIARLGALSTSRAGPEISLVMPRPA